MAHIKDLDCTKMTQNMDRWWTVVCTVRNLRASRKTADFYTGWATPLFRTSFRNKVVLFLWVETPSFLVLMHADVPSCNTLIYFMFEFPCIITVYCIKNQQMQLWQYCLLVTARSLYTLPLDLGHPYWIYIIRTHGMHQWLLLQLLILLMMDAESVRNV